MTWDRTRPDGVEGGDWDAALRLSDRVTLALLGAGEGAHFRYLAARLSDGGGDDTLYPDRDAAAARQLSPEHCAYVRITPDGMGPMDAARYLSMARQIRGRWRTPLHQGPIPIMPGRLEHARRLWRAA